MKRKRGGGLAADTPTKRAATEQHITSEDELVEDTITVDTPSKRQRKPTARFEEADRTQSTPSKSRSAQGTPRSQRKVNLVTPSKAPQDAEIDGTPILITNADRSARRKTSRRLIERTLEDGNSDEEISDSDEDIARELLDGEDDEAGGDDDGIVNGHGPEEDTIGLETPSKRRRGRPKGRTRAKRSPTPPQNLPPHEQYFWQNRPGGNKTSNNTLSSAALLNHDEYFEAMQSYEDPHQEQRDFLLSLHARSYSQWTFELEQKFNICLYGYGSKRLLLTEFASYLNEKLDDPPKIVVVNGYAPGISIKDILTTITSTLLPSHLQLPIHPTALLDLIIEALSSDSKSRVLVLLNSIDATALRRTATQQILASLAAHDQISLVATADALNFPLLWDTSLRSQFRFLFHDTTTFAPYQVEIDVVESVNDLLGRSGRRGIGGKDGVAFVLRSLPANARSLFRVLVAEQVAAAFEDPEQAIGGAEKGDEARDRMAGGSETGVEYRLLYRKACEELICTNENGFRTLLKEFFDHQMVESRRDALGAERLFVPFRREELEELLEDLVD